MRKSNRSANIYWSMVIGVVIAIALSVLSAAMGAVFIDNETITIEAIPYITFVVWVISGFLCAYISGRTGEEKWSQRSVIAVIIYCIVLLCVGILIFDGIDASVLYGLLGNLLGLICAVLLVTKRKRMSAGRKLRKFKMK